ncbi:MAG: acylphosphatase [Candidatus Omnitrophota bacterium]|nr:acylphosphatase [Candidatus Omnitrophota bacterium]
MAKCLKALFRGTVQGVGFRYTAGNIAKRFDVTGYVRNLPNGQVEMTAEGEEATLMEFLNAVRESSLAAYIRDVEVEWSESQGIFRDFRVAL